MSAGIFGASLQTALARSFFAASIACHSSSISTAAKLPSRTSPGWSGTETSFANGRGGLRILACSMPASTMSCT
jgi:predicted CxxxxCH...CXXCH cytochrome family protein